MNYLLIYMALGIAFAITVLVVNTDVPIGNRVIYGMCFWLFWPLIVAAYIHQLWIGKHIASTCAWCGEAMENSNLDAWKQHALVCQKHPLRTKIEELEKENDRLFRALDELSGKVVAFAGQLQAWDFPVAASEMVNEILSGNVNAPDYYALQAENARLKDCEHCLLLMVQQYCSDGNGICSHDFMTAGEESFEYLVKNGLATWCSDGINIVLRAEVE